MKVQNQIKRTLSQAESIEHIKSRLTDLGSTSRTKFAEEVCEHYNFFDPVGNKQIAGCLKALRILEKQGWFILPQAKSQKSGQSVGMSRLDEPVPQPDPLPERAGQIAHLKLVRVMTQPQLRIWNELMICDHPQGERPLVGRQIRYLIKSEQGWLGGVGFSSSALNLEARDQWIGWDWEARQERLHYIVNMSRFLIRDGVKCRNLASKVLGLSVRALPTHYEETYGYRPLLLESFIDTAHHQGTCYKAANWQWVGQTRGRGRQDTLRQAPETIKDIYMYPLVQNFREQLGLEKTAGLGPLSVLDSIEGEDWEEREFGGAPLGDKRLSKRLVEIGRNKVENPGSSYGDAACGELSKVKAYYRFIDQADDSAVTPENMLLPHRQQTLRRMKAEKTVLCLQDGTDLNYSGLSDCSGLGQIGTNQTGATSAGLHLHTTLAVTTEGVPLGVLKAQCSAPEKKRDKEIRKPKDIPIEEKKTWAWIAGLRDTNAVKAQMPHTAIINVMDREADFFELFDEQRNECPGVELLVRAKHDRKTAQEISLFETVRNSRPRKTLTIQVARQSARAKKSKQQARDKRLARGARVALRYQQVELKSPTHHKTKQTLTLWAVHIREYQTTQDVVPLEWFLLTTLAIESPEDALKCIEWYKLRWRIEDWHRVLKSGCGVENMLFKTAERLKRGIAINIVVAWRIMLMTLLGRESPSLTADILFSDLETRVLTTWAKKKAMHRQKHLVTQ